MTRLKKIAAKNPNEFNLALTKFVSKELSKENIKHKARQTFLELEFDGQIEDKYSKMVVDCLDGKIFLRGQGYRDKQIGTLLRFEGEREADALYSKDGIVKQIIRHYNNYNKKSLHNDELVVESNQ